MHRDPTSRLHMPRTIILPVQVTWEKSVKSLGELHRAVDCTRFQGLFQDFFSRLSISNYIYAWYHDIWPMIATQHDNLTSHRASTFWLLNQLCCVIVDCCRSCFRSCMVVIAMISWKNTSAWEDFLSLRYHLTLPCRLGFGTRLTLSRAPFNRGFLTTSWNFLVQQVSMTVGIQRRFTRSLIRWLLTAATHPTPVIHLDHNTECGMRTHFWLDIASDTLR
jgi:hypothetical protein